MNRKEFFKMCGLLGLSVPLQGLISGCASSSEDSSVKGRFEGKVLIIGAGAAGMAAGYLLAQNGVEFEILEASGTHGGRMKQTTSFVDFPIPLGAEWLHSSTSEFSEIINDSAVEITTQTIGYSYSDVVGHFEDGQYMTEVHGDPGEDKKFINSTWFDFFNTYIAPTVLPKTRFNKVVSTIDYSGDKVVVSDDAGQTHYADRVIFTAPIKILQDNVISFSPLLPRDKQRALKKAAVWGGIKVFLEFSEKFYPTLLSFEDSDTKSGQRIYYDAAYGQDSKSNVLGLFAVGKQAEQYQQLTGQAQKDYVLAELDEVFEGTASKTYVQHIVQNWSDEPYIRCAYLSDVASYKTSTILAKPLADRLYFAGEAYTEFDDWGSVHVAARAARDVVRKILIQS